MPHTYSAASIEACTEALCQERYGRALAEINVTIAATLRGEVRRVLALLEPAIAERIRGAEC